ncbi:MAG: DUF547 domain-containing protein [bacterium]|nr:DUF547 domain-containing protein [bacterium]
MSAGARRTPEVSAGGDPQRLAALINAYHDIVRTAPRRHPSWWGFIRYFLLDRHPVEGRAWSLYRLEAEIRGSGDPRIHFALNCGAVSCPPIREYEAEHLDAQLAIATRSYLADPAGCRFDAETRTLHLSRLFRWYRRDFGDVLTFVRHHLEPEQAEALEGPGLRIRYLDWDWTPT